MIRSRTIIHPEHFLHLNLVEFGFQCDEDTADHIPIYRTMLVPNFVATTRNNQEDVFQRLGQSLRIADCLLQASIFLPTRSAEDS